MKNNNHLLDNVEEFELSPINDSEIESKKKINLSKSAKAAIIFEAIILVVLIIILIVIFFFFFFFEKQLPNCDIFSKRKW